MVPSPFASTPAFRQTRSAASTSSHACGSETSKPSTRSRPRTVAPSFSSARTSAWPIPPAAPVTTAVSGNKDDLAGRAARGDQLVRLGRLVERELGADDRPDRSSLPEDEQLTHLVAHELGPEAQQPPEVEADHAEVAADEPRRVDRLPGAAGEADRDRDAERAQRAEARGEDRAADGVDRDVDVVQLADLLVRDRADRAELARQLELLVRARDGGHPRAAEGPELDRSSADTARRRRD